MNSANHMQTVLTEYNEHASDAEFSTLNLEDLIDAATVYKHPSLLRKSSNSIHTRGTYESYNPLFSHLVWKLRQVTNPIFGSDDEKSLVKEIGDRFPDAGQLCCTKHNMADYTKGTIGLAMHGRQELISSHGLFKSE